MKAKTTKFTEKQTAVLCGILSGKTYEAIGTELGLSRETIKTYVSRLRIKTNTGNKVMLALWIAKHKGDVRCGNC